MLVSPPPTHTPPEGFVLATGTDPAEDLIGPFFFRRDPTGVCTGVCFWSDVQHTNGMRTALGGWLIGTGEVIRRTRSLTFLRDELRCGNDVVVSWHGIGKRIPKNVQGSEGG